MEDVCKEIQGIVYLDEVIEGAVVGDGAISGEVMADGEINGMVNYKQCTELPTYSGSYTVIPSSQEQILDTEDKIMEEDVDVKAIPYYETSNEYGTTIFIAGEL